MQRVIHTESHTYRESDIQRITKTECHTDIYIVRHKETE